jgi:hypothetical protein
MPPLPLPLPQLEVVRQEAGRLQSENNDLHVQLIAEAEKYAALQKDAYAKTKGLEDKVGQLLGAGSVRCSRAGARNHARALQQAPPATRGCCTLHGVARAHLPAGAG